VHYVETQSSNGTNIVKPAQLSEKIGNRLSGVGKNSIQFSNSPAPTGVSADMPQI